MSRLVTTSDRLKHRRTLRHEFLREGPIFTKRGTLHVALVQKLYVYRIGGDIIGHLFMVDAGAF